LHRKVLKVHASVDRSCTEVTDVLAKSHGV
jgi:hypothetical protein